MWGQFARYAKHGPNTIVVASQTIMHMIKDSCSNIEIPLPNVIRAILARVIEYCKKHVYAAVKKDKEKDSSSSASASSVEVLKTWDADFVKIDQNMLFDLILVPNVDLMFDRMDKPTLNETEHRDFPFPLLDIALLRITLIFLFLIGPSGLPQAVGKAGQDFMMSLNLDIVYDYMFHLLIDYSKLQDFILVPPPSALEVCPDSLLCLADQKQNEWL